MRSEDRAHLGSLDSVRRRVLFVSAALLGIGFVTFFVAAGFHPHEIDPNDHPTSFTQYAQSSGWAADHFLFFVSAVIMLAGVVALFEALNLNGGITGLTVRLGIAAAGVAVALSAMRYAVDGVVLKRAVDAWASAPDADKMARFVAAEVARWLEEATASYQSFAIGLTLLLVAALIVWTGRVPRAIGVLSALAAAGYFVLGWIVGAAGFAPQGAIPANVTEFYPLVTGAYIAIAAWRLPARPAAVADTAGSDQDAADSAKAGSSRAHV